jgi:hypothetical protein
LEGIYSRTGSAGDPFASNIFHHHNNATALVALFFKLTILVTLWRNASLALRSNGAIAEADHWINAIHFT